MFYRIDEEKNIIDKANFKYADDCLETDKNIVRGFDGKLVFEEETLTNEYKLAEEKAKTELANNKKLTDLTNWFDNYFDKQLKQSQWQKNFKVSPDPYLKDEKDKPRIYADIEELKAQAEIVRETINSLRDEV